MQSILLALTMMLSSVLAQSPQDQTYVLEFTMELPNPILYQSLGEIHVAVNNAESQHMEVRYNMRLSQQGVQEFSDDVSMDEVHVDSELDAVDAFTVQSYAQLHWEYTYLEPEPMNFDFHTLQKSNGEVLAENQFYPSYQNTPIFPSNPIPVNSHWKSLGVRVLDLREFGIEEPYSFVFPVSYHFYHVEAGQAYIWFQAIEDHSFELPIEPGSWQQTYNADTYSRLPVRIYGIREGTLVFDIEQGILTEIEFESSIVEILKNGTVNDYAISQRMVVHNS